MAGVILSCISGRLAALHARVSSGGWPRSACDAVLAMLRYRLSSSRSRRSERSSSRDAHGCQAAIGRQGRTLAAPRLTQRRAAVSCSGRTSQVAEVARARGLAALGRPPGGAAAEKKKKKKKKKNKTVRPEQLTAARRWGSRELRSAGVPPRSLLHTCASPSAPARCGDSATRNAGTATSTRTTQALRGHERSARKRRRGRSEPPGDGGETRVLPIGARLADRAGARTHRCGLANRRRTRRGAVNSLASTSRSTRGTPRDDPARERDAAVAADQHARARDAQRPVRAE